MSLEDFLDMRCDVLGQPEGAVDEIGGVDRDTYLPVATGAWCLVRPLGVDNSPRQGKAALNMTHRVYFASDPGTTTKHQLRLSDGRVLSVVGPVDFNSRGDLFAVDCTEMHE